MTRFLLLLLASLYLSQFRRDCLCLLIGKTQVMTWVELLSSIYWKDTNYDLILIVDRLKKIFYNEPVQISQYTRVGGNHFRHCNFILQSPRFSNQDSVFTSKFQAFFYYFLSIK